MPSRTIEGYVVDARGLKVRNDKLTIGFNEGDDRLYVRIISPKQRVGHKPRELWISRDELVDMLHDLLEEFG